MSLGNFTILVYTHSEYSFLWKPFINLMQKYCEKGIPIHFLYNSCSDVNTVNSLVPSEWVKHTYNNNTIWSRRVLDALNKINTKYVLYLHEDWVPIGDIKIKIIKDMMEFMDKKNADILLSYMICGRLHSKYLQSSEEFSNYENYSFFKEIDHCFQPAIWKKSTLEELCQLNKRVNQNEDSDTRKLMCKKNCYCIQHVKTINTIGTSNSLFYPHMHAIHHGLWTFKRYPELKQLMESFGVNTKNRGVNNSWEIGFK